MANRAVAQPRKRVRGRAFDSLQRNRGRLETRWMNLGPRGHRQGINPGSRLLYERRERIGCLSRYEIIICLAHRGDWVRYRGWHSSGGKRRSAQGVVASERPTRAWSSGGRRISATGSTSTSILMVRGWPISATERPTAALVPPGDHLIRIKQMPHWNDAYPYSEQWIRVAQDRPNVFTATWTDGGTRISLL